MQIMQFKNIYAKKQTYKQISDIISNWSKYW